ncbi:glycosyltransferase family 4 protein [Sphingobacterium hungaricum]
MKVLYISHYDSLYGANRSLVSLVSSLHSLDKVDCRIIVQKEGELSSFLKVKGIPYYVIPFRNEVGYKQNRAKGLLYFIFNILLCLVHFRKLKSEKFDLIHTNSSISFFGCYLSFFLQTKHVYHLREFLDQDYNLFYLSGKKFSDYMIGQAQKVIAISRSVQQKRWPKSTVIYNGIIEETNLPRRTDNIKTNFVASVIGHINPGKNQLEAVKSILVLNEKYNVKLNIVGSGDDSYLQSIKDFVIKHNIVDKVSFIGYQKDVKPYYLQSDFLFMCSLNEGLGRVTIEGMAYGAIVLGFNNAGTAEIITDGCNGFLYNTTDELISKTQICIEDVELRQKIRESALKDAVDRFSVESYSKEILSIYKDIVYAS